MASVFCFGFLCPINWFKKFINLYDNLNAYDTSSEVTLYDFLKLCGKMCIVNTNNVSDCTNTRSNNQNISP